MSEFDALQATIARNAATRQADANACEALLNALYHALRSAGGPGLPLNNVTMEIVPDPGQRLKPAPVGDFHAAWFRLGLCEVLVRVRRQGHEFHGEYGYSGVFAMTEITVDSLVALARRVLRDIADVYAGESGPTESRLN